MKTGFSLKNKKIWVAGHRGMVGSALMRRLAPELCEILTARREECDLRDAAAVERWMAENRPDAVILAAARVGGIIANANYPADFLYDNLMIAANVIHAAHRHDVSKLLYLGSSCIYPKDAAQPMAEDALLSGPLEPTNEAYAIAKIAGIKLCAAYRRQHGRDFISAMPCNLYGPGDRYDPEYSHVIPAMIMKLSAARDAGAERVELMGTGSALREFLYVEDLADALVFLLENYSDAPHINVGSGGEISIRDLTAKIAQATGFRGQIVFTGQGWDGVPRKLMDNARLAALGWKSATDLDEGLKQTVFEYDKL